MSTTRLFPRIGWTPAQRQHLREALEAKPDTAQALIEDYRKRSGDTAHTESSLSTRARSMAADLGLELLPGVRAGLVAAKNAEMVRYEMDETTADRPRVDGLPVYLKVPKDYMGGAEVGLLFGQGARWVHNRAADFGLVPLRAHYRGRPATFYERASVELAVAREREPAKPTEVLVAPVETLAPTPAASSAPATPPADRTAAKVRAILHAADEGVLTPEEMLAKLRSI